MADTRMTNVTICGGGNGAHVVTCLSAMVEDCNITVVDIYMDEAERWTAAAKQHGLTVNYPDGTKKQRHPGSVGFTVTTDLGSISTADVIIICVPAYTHYLYLTTIAPLLADSTLVVGMPGQPGFEYQSKTILEEHGKKCNIMALSTMPWACRIKQYGREVDVFGTKDEVEFSFVKNQNIKTENKVATPLTVQKLLGERPVLKQVNHVLQLCLASKASIHPPLMYSKWRQWDGKPLSAPPLFYQGVDEQSTKVLDAVSDEIIDIAKEVGRRFPEIDLSGLLTMQQWLVNTYGVQIEDQTSLLSCLKTNNAYNGLCHPMIKVADGQYVPDFSYRYTTEDIPYGLVVLRQMAEFVDVKTPNMDEVIEWAQTKLERTFLVDGKISGGDRLSTRLPTSYGISSIEDLVQRFE